jgi:hypothetical protein
MRLLASPELAPVPSHSVEHSCYQCGASVEDGLPFCRTCRAPQIRVATAEAVVPAEMERESFSPRYSAALPSARFNWPLAMRAAVLAGLAGLVLFIILPRAFALDMVTSGFLAFYFYYRQNPFSKLSAGTGALLGALSGGFATVLMAVPLSFMIFLVRSGGERRTEIMAALQDQLGRNPDPHVHEVLEHLKTPDGFTLIMIVFLIVMLILCIVLSSLGGAIGAALLRRKQRL